MMIRKSVLKARLEKKLALLDQKEADYLMLWPAYKNEMIGWEERYLETLKSATSEKDWQTKYNAICVFMRPASPQRPYGLDEKRKQIQRNLAILDALDGDTIEVGARKTGRNFTLEKPAFLR